MSFGTEAIRERVLAAWRASPARFREDANAEEDYVLGGYRDRVIIELAQNAADAGGGRLRFTLDNDVLEAANTGTPLSAEGVEALSTLRASAKRTSGSVGRFGVGFAAVVSVSDEPMIVSTTGSVGWSRSRTRALVAAEAALADELARRDGHVPLLRLPFDVAQMRPPEGFDTVVRLPLRDAASRDSVERQLAEALPWLLLVLPALNAVEVNGRTVTAQRGDAHVVIESDRWSVVDASGDVQPELLADRPTEERQRPWWSVRWAVGPAPGVVLAPTPTAEPLGLPAALIASFPLAPDRRHVEPGRLTDFLVAQAASAYVPLVTEPDMIPGPLASGELDARLRRAILAELAETPFLPGGLRPREAVVLEDPRAWSFFAEAVPGLLPASWPAGHHGMRQLGVRTLSLADAVDALAGLHRQATWWHDLYDALDGADLSALAGLPVPLADGRVVRGARGSLVLAGIDVGALGLRIVDAAADHRLLRLLGAVEATPLAILDDPLTRAAVAASLDSGEPIADAVLSLVAQARLRAGDAPWLAELALPAGDGSRYPAGELLLPDGPLRPLVAKDAPFAIVDPDLVARFGAPALEAVGVLGSFAVVRDEDVVLDRHDCDHDLDGEDEWIESAGFAVPPVCPAFAAVRDLEFIADWARALDLLARPPLREVVTTPALPGMPSYTAWWLSRHAVLNGVRPRGLRLPGDPLLNGLYGEADLADEEFASAIGVRTTLAALLGSPEGPDELLARMADPARPVSRPQLRSLWAAIAPVDASLVTPPSQVRSVLDGGVVVASADDVVVVEAPDLLPLLAGRPLVLAPHDLAEALADLLDLPLAGETVTGAVSSSGTETRVPEEAGLLLGAAPSSYAHHDSLIVDGVAVSWRYVDGVLHASGMDGLARGLAWAAGRWDLRHAVAAVLRSPELADLLLAEADLDQ